MIAQNVYMLKDLPELIDYDYINSELLYKGSIAFFVDDLLGLLALPYVVIGKNDIYNRPKMIQCIGKNGYNSKKLKSNEFVIMYDNSMKTTIVPYLNQYAERLALIQRTIDINIEQQKTPRIIKAPKNQLLTVQTAMNNIDACEGAIFAYDSFDIESLETILTPAPYVSDKLEEEKEKIWNEALRFVGVANLTEQKKERLITSEVTMTQGGTIASRINRYECRKKAVDEIERKFDIKLGLAFYDGLPSNLKEQTVNLTDLKSDSGEVDDNVY